MKKIIGLVLAFCLVFSLVAGAFADSKPTITKEGSRDQNREWEVGHNYRYNDIDDEQQLKR